MRWESLNNLIPWKDNEINGGNCYDTLACLGWMVMVDGLLEVCKTRVSYAIGGNGECFLVPPSPLCI